MFSYQLLHRVKTKWCQCQSVKWPYHRYTSGAIYLGNVRENWSLESQGKAEKKVTSNQSALKGKSDPFSTDFQTLSVVAISLTLLISPLLTKPMLIKFIYYIGFKVMQASSHSVVTIHSCTKARNQGAVGGFVANVVLNINNLSFFFNCMINSINWKILNFQFTDRFISWIYCLNIIEQIFVAINHYSWVNTLNSIFTSKFVIFLWSRNHWMF